MNTKFSADDKPRFPHADVARKIWYGFKDVHCNMIPARGPQTTCICKCMCACVCGRVCLVNSWWTTFASIFAEISSVFVMVLMLQTRSRRINPRTVTYSGGSFWSFWPKWCYYYYLLSTVKLPLSILSIDLRVSNDFAHIWASLKFDMLSLIICIFGIIFQMKIRDRMYSECL